MTATKRQRAIKKLLCIGLSCWYLCVSIVGAAPSVDIATITEQANRGDAKALYSLGVLHEVGKQVSQDLATAARMYENAAKRGHTGAKSRLGYLYQTGAGVERNAAKAFALYSEAAEAGDVGGQFLLAVAYINGVGTKQNAETARKWLTRAANGGHQQSQLMLGVMLQQGTGGDKNEFTARRRLKEAEEGKDESIATKARTLREQIDRRILDSSAFSAEAWAAIVAVGFGLAVLLASAGNQNAGTTDYKPDVYEDSPWPDAFSCSLMDSDVQVWAGCYR